MNLVYKIIKIVLICVIIFSVFPKNLLASEINCDNRYLTLVNPVRGRDLWFDKSLKPIQDQYQLAAQNNFPISWLLQYDVLKDSELLGEIKKFDQSHEFGVFLEVSPKLAEDSRVIYPYDAPWFAPNAVFLSGYSQSERRKIIDKLFSDFKKEFSFYPKSVGAWWVDSYSLNYLKEKYEIKAVLIVADQKTTDNYGVWGQWWGVPYFPDKANILTPASLGSKEDLIVIQWAQRDPILAYGSGPEFSNYSLQANDYVEMGKDTLYFEEIAKVYLDCEIPVGQITVGLETGMESVGSIGEYKRQLDVLKNMGYVKAVTMSDFSLNFKLFYQFDPKEKEFSYRDSKWVLTATHRENFKLGDLINYQRDVAFEDYFLADKNSFLDRNVDKLTGRENIVYFPWFLLVIIAVGAIGLVKKFGKVWLAGTIFIFAAFGLILKSHLQYGWQVFYGPVTSNLAFTQVLVVLVSYGVVYFISRNKKVPVITLWLLPLVFGLDWILQMLRASLISGKYYFGVAVDSLRFVGFSFEKPFNLEFVNRDFPPYLAAGLLRFDFDKIWDNLFLSILVYPASHILIALIFGWWFVKLNLRIRNIIFVALVILFLLHLLNISQADPRLVQ